MHRSAAALSPSRSIETARENETSRRVQLVSWLRLKYAATCCCLAACCWCRFMHIKATVVIFWGNQWTIRSVLSMTQERKQRSVDRKYVCNIRGIHDGGKCNNNTWNEIIKEGNEGSRSLYMYTYKHSSNHFKSRLVFFFFFCLATFCSFLFLAFVFFFNYYLLLYCWRRHLNRRLFLNVSGAARDAWDAFTRSSGRVARNCLICR